MIEALLSLLQEREGEAPATHHDLQKMEARILDLLFCLRGHSRHSYSPARFAFGIGLACSKTKPNIPLMNITLTTEQKVTVTLKPVTHAGKPAKLDGSPAWTVTSGNALVTVSEDGLSAVLTSPDDPGVTEILVKADADLGAGIVEISDSIVLTVISAMATNLGLEAGAPEDK